MVDFEIIKLQTENERLKEKIKEQQKEIEDLLKYKEYFRRVRGE